MDKPMTKALKLSQEEIIRRNVRMLDKVRRRFAHWWDIEECAEICERVKFEGIAWIDEEQHQNIRELIRKAMAWPQHYDMEAMDLRPKVLDEYGRHKPTEDE